MCQPPICYGRRDEALTVGLRSVPEHNTTERRVLAARLEGNVDQRSRINVTRAASSRRGKSADVDLDILVRGDGLSPGVP